MRSRYIDPGATRSTVGATLEKLRPSVRPGVVLVSGYCALICAPATLWNVRDPFTPPGIGYAICPLTFGWNGGWTSQNADVRGARAPAPLPVPAATPLWNTSDRSLDRLQLLVRSRPMLTPPDRMMPLPMRALASKSYPSYTSSTPPKFDADWTTRAWVVGRIRSKYPHCWPPAFGSGTPV